MFRRSTDRHSRPARLATIAAAAVLSLSGAAHATLADADKSGHVGLEDLSAYLTAWINRDKGADIDQNGDISIQDLFDFIAEWMKQMSNPDRNAVPRDAKDLDEPEVDTSPRTVVDTNG